MKNQYTQYIGRLQDLINLEYPGQKLYPGITQDIYKLTKLIERGENINNISLIHTFLCWSYILIFLYKQPIFLFLYKMYII